MQIFEAVVLLGCYTRAAKELDLSQPAVSMQVKKISESIGHPLLERVGNNLHTTSVGDEVYSTSKNILNNMRLLGESTAELDGAIKGPLRIAVITTAKYFMAHLLGAFIHSTRMLDPY